MDFLLIMQGRARHTATRNDDWLERGNRCQNAGAADLNENVAQLRLDRSASYLKAMAQRGDLAVMPNDFR